MLPSTRLGADSRAALARLVGDHLPLSGFGTKVMAATSAEEQITTLFPHADADRIRAAEARGTRLLQVEAEQRSIKAAVKLGEKEALDCLKTILSRTKTKLEAVESQIEESLEGSRAESRCSSRAGSICSNSSRRASIAGFLGGRPRRASLAGRSPPGLLAFPGAAAGGSAGGMGAGDSFKTADAHTIAEEELSEMSEFSDDDTTTALGRRRKGRA